MLLVELLSGEPCHAGHAALRNSANSDCPHEPEPAALSVCAEIHRLIETEIPFLQRAARRWQRNVSDAEDLLQETLVRALASAHLWQPGSNLRAWLVTIMRNEFFSALVRAERRSATADPGDVLALDPSMDAETRLTLRDVDRALRRLPAKQRAAVRLAGIEGKSYAEVASIMELSVDAVRCHLARARDQLREDVFLAEEALPIRHSANQARSRHRACGDTLLRPHDRKPRPFVEASLSKRYQQTFSVEKY